MQLSKSKIFHLILCFTLVIFMVAAAEFAQEKEIIFPEIAALAIGAWIAPKQVWLANRITIIILISINACLGVCISTFVPLPLYFKAMSGLFCAALSIILSRSTFFPAISACVLPIFLNTKGWIYSISAIAMTIIICCIQCLLEKTGRTKINQKQVRSELQIQELKLWLLRYIFLLVISIFPLSFGHCFFVAPPLIVAFIEFTQPNSPAVSKIKKIFLLIFIAAFGGTISRLIFTVGIHMPLTISAMIAILLLLTAMSTTKVYFPPAGAIAILPMLIDKNFLILYPFEVIIGFTILYFLALSIRKIT